MSDEAKTGNEIRTASEVASMGGRAAARKMTAVQKSERAKLAAAKRWGGDLPRATHGSEDHPLRISGIEIPCYVLSDGKRVLVSTSMVQGLDMSLGTAGGGEGDRLGRFLAGKTINPFVTNELVERINNPIRFINTRGMIVRGYEATILADLCDVVLAARGALRRSQMHIVNRCELLLRGFARVGIVALIDEVTGYQEARERDALAKILEAFIAKELQPYVRTFEADYYKAICTLRSWEYKTSSRRPRALAQVTNDIVYSRLAPGVLDKLREKNPVVKDGRRGAKHFQWLTDNKGHPDLRAHLQRITGWMEMSETWEEFYRVLNDRKPPYRSPRNRGPGLFDDLPDELEEGATTLPSSSTEPEPPAEQSPTSARE